MPVKPIPDGYQAIQPYLIVDGAARAIEFYKTVLGAAERMRLDAPGGRIGHAELTVGDSLVMVGQAGSDWKPLTAALYVWVPDVDPTYARAVGAGATSQSAPENKPYGHRVAGVVDTNGITWWIASPIA